MADSNTNASPVWKWTYQGTDGFFYGEGFKDGTIKWYPNNPPPAILEKGLTSAKNAGFLHDDAAKPVSTAQAAVNNTTGESPAQQESKSKTISSKGNPVTFPAKVQKYLNEDYKGVDISKIPQDELASSWDQYVRDEVAGKGSFKINDPRFKQLMNVASIYEGNGPYFNQFQTFFTCLDRYGGNIMLTNIENTGVTFITRPRLCLQSTNLRSQRRMMLLDSDHPNTIAFAIRALLDTNLDFDGKYTDVLNNCPLVDPQNPFFTPLCNGLLSMTGLPDIAIRSETTDGGYMSEAQQYAIGGDDLSTGQYQITLSFRDIQGGIISSIFYFWLEYIRCVTRGLMLAYSDDIDEQCLNYTVSIYHFNLDPSGTYITDWVKCTGCYPTSMPIGAKLQVNEGEKINRANDKIDVLFVCNKVEYRDYAIFMDFDTLVRRYCPIINKMKNGSEFQPGPDSKGNIVSTADRYTDASKQLQAPTLPRVAWSNFRGLPWITSDVRGPKLEYRRVSNPVFQRVGDKDDDLGDQLIKTELAQAVANKYLPTNYVKSQSPEYLKASEEFPIIDLRDFIYTVSAQAGDYKNAEPVNTNNKVNSSKQ